MKRQLQFSLGDLLWFTWTVALYCFAFLFVRGLFKHRAVTNSDQAIALILVLILMARIGIRYKRQRQK